MIYGILGVIIGILVFLLFQKQKLDHSAASKLQQEITQLISNKAQLDDKLEQTNEAIRQAEENYKKNLTDYNNSLKTRREELENSAKELAAKIDADAELQRVNIKHELEHYKEKTNEEIKNLGIQLAEKMMENQKAMSELDAQLADRKECYAGLVQPFKVLEQEREQVSFYCLQVPQTDIEDIDYLLTQVAPHVNNKDIIPKLVWATYIQRPAQELMKRAEIDETPGIYKITNVGNGKSYVGKSTKVRSRLLDHIKSAIGISTISDQRFHHDMLAEGLWNFTFEKLCDCDKDKLNEKEKYYIDYFGTTEYGYNIKAGG